MIDIAIENDAVVVQLSGWDRVFAVKRSVRLPLTAVTSARPAPELATQRPRGFRFPGLAWPFWPGPVFEGSFIELNGRRTFWAVRRPRAEQILAIEVNDDSSSARYRRFVLQVADPASAADQIRQATDRLSH